MSCPCGARVAERRRGGKHRDRDRERLETVLQRCLAEYERDYVETGDSVALLYAVAICAANELVLPAWAAEAFLARFRKAYAADVMSWDAAFGRPFPKSMRQKTAQQRFDHEIYCAVRRVRDWRPGDAPLTDWLSEWWAAHDKPVVIDAALFERIGAQFDLGKTACARRYYESKKFFQRFGLD